MPLWGKLFFRTAWKSFRYMLSPLIKQGDWHYFPQKFQQKHLDKLELKPVVLTVWSVFQHFLGLWVKYAKMLKYSGSKAIHAICTPWLSLSSGEKYCALSDKNLSLTSWVNLAGLCGTCMLVLLIMYLIAENGAFICIHVGPCAAFVTNWMLINILLFQTETLLNRSKGIWMQSIVTQWEWRNISYHLSAILTSVNSQDHMCNSNHLCRESLRYSPVT